MKKTLITMLPTLLVAVHLQATQFWYDPVSNYPLGCITTNTAIWFPHLPGGLTANDAVIVTNSYTSGAATNSRLLRVNGLKSEYIMRLFDPINTNSINSGVIYFSFIANANFVPAGGQGTYFATLNDLGSPPSATNGFNFRGRVFEIGNTNAFPFTNTLSSTFHYGIANGAGDPAQGGSPSILDVPIDLIRNVDYQVVVKYIIDDGIPADANTAFLWVNPASEGDTANMAGPTADTGATVTGLGGLLFRQRTGGGTVDVRDVVVGDTFADVMTNTTPHPVLIATNYNTVSTYAGNPALLEVFATSIGGGPLSYQWYQIAGGATNAVGGANAQKLFIPSLSATHQGNYFCAITNVGGLGALSRTNFSITVNSTPTPPTFTLQPTNTSVSVGSTLTMACSAFGTGPLSFQWFLNGNPLTDGQPGTSQPGDISLVSGSQSPALSIALVSTNEDGNYSVTVTGGSPPAATSTNAAVTVRLPSTRTIAFLRSLLNTTTWQPTDTSTPYNITGVITTATNLTGGTTSSYYIQDSTAGINLFITGDSTFRPNRGDLVTATGTLSSFNNSLELAINVSNPYLTYSILSHSNTVPAPYVFYPPLTNNAGLMETNIEGRFVMLTNVYFPSDGTVLFPSSSQGANVIVTNQAGVPFILFISGQPAEFVGKPMPRFAWSVLGAMSQFQGGNYSSAGYQLNPTTLSDIVTDPPPPVTVSVSQSGANIVLNWTAVPYNYSYSVLKAGTITGPWTPLVTGLTFTSDVGTYTNVAPASSTQFYRIQTP